MGVQCSGRPTGRGSAVFHKIVPDEDLVFHKIADINELIDENMCAHENYFVPIEIENKKELPVAGARFIFTVLVGESNCRKQGNDINELKKEDCIYVEGSPKARVTLDLWHRPWLKSPNNEILTSKSFVSVEGEDINCKE
ncbi:unnamed protein product [Caenorhabditis bovis]|uniref:Cystatin domain-containing protein n=1 Tax=Caenorhabditis bovis TaxID=2654633 RepID=A0A8S1EC79_9PELO|nr:unnamed protein product [Caenorhabditis bovis]